MILKCNREKLSEACSVVQRAVPSKSTIPALEGILLSAKDDTLTLSGYDMQMGIKTSINADIKKEGAVIINAKLLTDITRRMPGEEVSLECDDKYTVLIKSGEAEYSVMGFADEEYPDMPVVDNGKNAEISGEILKSMIQQTIFAVSQNDSKPVHTGILFEINDSSIRLVAVDGYRLAIRTENVSGMESASFVVPGKTLNEISKLIGADEEKINIKLGGRHIIFDTGDYSIISRLFEGEFLDYRSAIPASAVTTVTVKTRELIDCIERISLMITEQDKSPVRCIFDDNLIKASCVTARGRGVDSVSADIKGDRIELGVNNRFLLDALRAASDCDEIKIELSGPVSPIKILPKDGEEFIFLVLPVRLKGNM